jgi:hypothetical protein
VSELTPAAVGLLRWIRRQLRQPTPEREHLEAAIAAGDVAEVRRLVARSPLSDEQRRYVERLLAEWEHTGPGLDMGSRSVDP